MPRQFWSTLANGNEELLDILRWQFDPANGPKEKDFVKPEDRPGWKVKVFPPAPRK